MPNTHGAQGIEQLHSLQIQFNFRARHAVLILLSAVQEFYESSSGCSLTHAAWPTLISTCITFVCCWKLHKKHVENCQLLYTGNVMPFFSLGLFNESVSTED